VAQALAHPSVEPVIINGRELPGVLLRTDTTRTEHHAPPALGADTDAVLAELDGVG